jgi:hypothetical protein
MKLRLRRPLSSTARSEQTNHNGAKPPAEIPEVPSSRDQEQAGVRQGADSVAVPPDLTQLSDGLRVEWVKDRANPARIRLLVWKDGCATIHDEVEEHHQIFRAPTFKRRLSDALYLPADILPGGTAAERTNEIASILSRHVPLADEACLLAASFALSTWFRERLGTYPYLVVTAPTGSGKTPFAKLMCCFCRRAVLLGDVSPAALYRIVDQVSPTLLLDECEFDGPGGSQALRRFLRVGNTPGEYVARGDGLFDSSCPKILCVNEAIEEVALSTRAIHVAMLPSPDAGRQYLDIDTLGRIAAEQQAKLLGFRLENIDRVCGLSQELAEKIETFSPKLRNIARALLLPIQADKCLESKLMQILEEQNESAVIDRSGEQSWSVVKGLYASYHLPQSGEATVGQIADKVNRIRAEVGDAPLSARKVGAVLKTLKIKTRSLGNWGRGIELTPQFRRNVHALARQFGITLRDVTNWMAVKGSYGGPACNLCAEFGLTDGLQPAPPLPHRARAPLFSASELDEHK